MSTAAFHLKRQRDEARESINKDSGECLFDDFTQDQLLDDNSIANDFIRFTEEHSFEFERASKYESDLVGHLNPNSKLSNRMFSGASYPTTRRLTKA